MNTWGAIGQYKNMLTLMGSLSRLFSESEIPFLDYRVTENLFCKYCNAKNLSRDDTAYDAKINDLGIGIKTFRLKKGKSTEKIAEFNALASQLRNLEGIDLANKLADFRNDRMKTANNLYGINKSIYHIIGRAEGPLEIFDTPYDFIDKKSIEIVDQTTKGLQFKDSLNSYSFNFSKSVLMKQFVVPEDKIVLPIKIIDDPFRLLQSLLENQTIITTPTRTEKDFVILPLFAIRDNEKYVPERSGLNQWNAQGRPRDPNEVYIPVPKKIHNEHPGFFPDRDTPFTLHLPNDRDTLCVKICQDGGKALMSNPNKALGQWILRDILGLKERELLSYNRLIVAGFDSLRITKIDAENYLAEVYEHGFLEE